MSTTGGTRSPRTLRRIVGASTVGTALEWYDFLLFGSAAALVFNDLFFPSFDETTGTILALGTFTAGFLARPVGGAIFGHYGDRVGRRRILVITLGMMGAATTLIGLLPTYETIGVWAPILLLTLRFVQGVGIGGEIGGAILMLAEHSSTRRRGLLASLSQVGAPAGNLLATGILFLFAATLSDDAFEAWGWRVPFLLSAVLLGVGLYVRIAVEETPAFRQLEQGQHKARAPLVEVLRDHRRPLLLALGARFGADVVVYVFLVFILTYASQVVDVSRSTALVAVSIGSAAWLVSIPLAGWLSDRFGRRPLYMVGAVSCLVWSFAFFPLLDTGSLVWLAVAAVVGLFCHGFMLGPQASFLAELFPTRVRYSGVSLGYQLTGIYGGSLAPIIALALLDVFDSSVAISLYMAATLLVTIVAIALSPERRGTTLDDPGIGRRPEPAPVDPLVSTRVESGA